MTKPASIIFISSLIFVTPSLASSATPVRLDALHSHRELSESRPWRAPDFADQQSALGWYAKAFEIPAGMEKRVQFWIDIYTRYTTKQGVIHDPENIDLVYEVVDFTAMEDSNLPASVKDKLKRKMVDDAKDKAAATLRKLADRKTPQGLTEDERRVWNRFAEDSDPKKFEKAADPSRLRFQLGQKDRMQSAIFLSGRYLEDFEEIFRKEGLPIELTRLVFVESSFNVLARSKVGASGLWQIMPGTARPFRAISTHVDMRNHPKRATRMAAKILASNYRMLGSWPLAVTGYNHGPAGVRKIVNRYDTRELPELIENVRSRASFGFASRNFYASFLAAYHVEKNAAMYFPGVQWSQALDAQEIKLPRSITHDQLLGWFGGDRSSLQIHNPHLTPAVRSRGIPQGVEILVPSGSHSKALADLGRSGRAVAAARKADPSRKPNAQASRGQRVVHRVARGENLTLIANSYGVNLADLLRENNLKLKQTIIPGQRIHIPD